MEWYRKVNPVTANHAYYYTNEDGTIGKGIYLAKTRDGIHFNHIARINFLGTKVSGLTGARYTTIDDPLVLKDYHDLLIPKAVKYAAGLLDYFFRGTMDINTIGYDTNSML